MYFITENERQRRTKHVKHHKKFAHKRQSSEGGPNRFCNCVDKMCNCCREFNVPILNVKGPGCAALQYLQGDQLAISMTFNERVLANTTIKGKVNYFTVTKLLVISTDLTFTTDIDKRVNLK